MQAPRLGDGLLDSAEATGFHNADLGAQYGEKPTILASLSTAQPYLPLIDFDYSRISPDARATKSASETHSGERKYSDQTYPNPWVDPRTLSDGYRGFPVRGDINLALRKLEEDNVEDEPAANSINDQAGTIPVRSWHRFDFLPGSEEKVSEDLARVVDENAESIVKITPFRFSPADGELEATGSLGTGFFVDENGTIATAGHVLPPTADGALIRMRNGEIRVATLVRMPADYHDLDILQVNNELAARLFPSFTVGPYGEKYDPVKLALDGSLQAGDQVVALGHPNGRELAASPGEFDEEKQDKRRPAPYPSEYHSDISVEPGNSGGPLIRVSDGAVIGVIVRKNQPRGFIGELFVHHHGIAEPAKYLEEKLRRI